MSSDSLLLPPDALIFAIESSCDEMAMALVQGKNILGEVTATQTIHAQYGGVVPELAARAHHLQLIPVAKKLLKKSKKKWGDIDAIAITQGPGLLGALLVGHAFARGLALALDRPLVGIHHLQAHLLVNFLKNPRPIFPALGLVVSGGHTDLLLLKSPFDLQPIGRSADDAIGEAFDKIGTQLGFDYPAGASIDKESQKGDPHRFSFPLTIMPPYHFSFSGIKTAVRQFLMKERQKNPHFILENRADLSASIQVRLIEMIAIQVEKACHDFSPKSFLVGGGVANNKGLRKCLTQLSQAHGIPIFLPNPQHTTDNAAMIGITAALYGEYREPLASLGPVEVKMPYPKKNRE